MSCNKKDKNMCNICHTSFSKRYNLERHILKASCNKKQNTSTSLIIDKKDILIKCVFCNKLFENKSRFDRHLLSDRGECYKLRNKLSNKKIKIVNKTINNITQHITQNTIHETDTKEEKFIVIKLPRRQKINQNKRIKIAASQKWRCNHCNMLFNEGGWDINHKLRVALGGTNNIENLEALCKNCHGIVTSNERIKDGF
jgi:5-methylcytosine-specific restriction endonuclease McrA